MQTFTSFYFLFQKIVFFLPMLMLCMVSGCDSSRTKVDIEKREVISVQGKSPRKEVLRFAVGAMITPKEGFIYYRSFLEYIEKKIEIPVEYSDQESYAEINKMLQKKELDIAFVCSGPYVDGVKDFGLEPLVAPQAYGKSVYYSYVIVPVDSKITTFQGLQGKKFAFTDPQSNTGCLVPTYMLARMNETPESFFEHYEYTYGHDKSIKAVALKLVDGAAVDSLIWEYANKVNPLYTVKTKIIYKSPPYGIPPVVVRPGLDPSLVEKLRDVFLNVHQDEQGRDILAGMMIEKFNRLNDRNYDSVREMKTWLSVKKRAE
jgi:phosphonate transport system substrate-binding protein